MCAFLRVPRLHPALPGGPSVAWGCAGVAVGGVYPPPLPFGFFSGGGALRRPLGPVVSVPPSPLVGAAICVFFVFFSSVVCVHMFWVFLLPVGRRSRFGVAAFGWVVLRCSFGWRVWPPLVVWVGGFLAVGLSRPPPVFYFGGGSACSSLCLPWAGVRTGRHSVWSSGLLLVLAFFQALPRPHGWGGLCTRWARCPYLPG